ncbi:MAG TPA: HEAT repeat domain-containing protein [Gemmatimonadales bacterium]|nr:HEAT repeat domain-containing protein [Gemmatimonadales bacterium]
MDELALPPSQITELLSLITKGVRATQLYLPNNPVYQRAVDNVRSGFRQVFQSVEELQLQITEGELKWEDETVYSHDNKSESIAWLLYKDGVRSLTFKQGVEAEELPKFLRILHQARTLQADAADDILTLLWEQDFQFIAHTFRELLSENAVPIEAGEPIPEVTKSDVVQYAHEEAPPRPKGMVSVDDFDTTLYFLDEKEIAYIHAEVDREYSQDLRGNVIAMLFDLLELQTYGTVRAELISILENLIPYLLGAGDFRSVSYILRETRVILQRARELIAEHKQSLESLPNRLSQPEALSQLLQSLDEATVHPTEDELSGLFQELRPEALITLMGWVPRLSNERVRGLVVASAEQLAQANAGEVLKALASEDGDTQLEMVKLAGRLKLAGAPEGMGKLLELGERPLKLAVVEALTAIGSPSAMRVMERAIEDPDRDVRIAGVKFLASKGHRNAFKQIDAAVNGSKLKDSDLTEKMAFFEAYGAMAGAAGVTPLARMLLSRPTLLGRGEGPETRACAAMALGKIKTPESRNALERAKDDKEALVRNAVSRALRELGA